MFVSKLYPLIGITLLCATFRPGRIAAATPTCVLRAGSITPILTEVITISAMAAAIWRAAIARYFHYRAHLS